MYATAFKHKHHISDVMKCSAQGILHIQISTTTQTHLTTNVMKSATVECCKITNIVSIWEMYNNQPHVC